MRADVPSASAASSPAGTAASGTVAVAGLRKSYGTVRAVRVLSFTAQRGEIFAAVIVFDDTGEILPVGQVIPPHRPAHIWLPAAAWETRRSTT